MDIAGIVLHNLLKDPESALEIWPKLKIQYFSTDYAPIYSAIAKYYDKYQAVPKFSDLKITIRDQVVLQKIVSLELLEIPEDIDIIVAVEALVDQDTQEEALNEISEFVDKIVAYDTKEVTDKLSEIVLRLEERSDTSEEIYLMNDIFTIDKAEALRKIPLGLNNTFDSNLGISLTELIMIGGYRGSGKTVAACNITVNQYNQGNVGLFFSIEMRYREIYNRFLSILSGVENSKLRKASLAYTDYEKLALTRSGMFLDSEEIYEDFKTHRNYEKFEIDLLSSKKLKQDNQFIIVDNQNLTLPDIDMNIQKFKTRYGDKLKVVVVDYLNSINIPDIYNWKVQITLSRKLKEFARKYDIVLVTPYQVDSSGEARFSKGILDKADISAVLKAEEDYITFKSTKTRNISPFEFNAPINWETFNISATDAVIDKVADSSDGKEAAHDLPWK